MSRRAPVAVPVGQTGDRQGTDIWWHLRQLGTLVNDSPFFGGRLITEEAGAVGGSGLSFTAATARSIPHQLGRKARGFLEVYGADVPSAGHVGLRATAHPAGTTSATHVTVTPAATGKCFLWVF